MARRVPFTGATSTVYQVDAVSSATKFSDVRHEGTLALGFMGRRSKISFSATLGTERDYLSRQIGGDASIDLPGRNTTVDLAYSHSFDEVKDLQHPMVVANDVFQSESEIELLAQRLILKKQRLLADGLFDDDADFIIDNRFGQVFERADGSAPSGKRCGFSRLLKT